MKNNQKGSAILAILIVLILAIAAAIGAGWYAYRFYSAPPENIDMPEINFSASPELLDENPRTKMKGTGKQSRRRKGPLLRRRHLLNTRPDRIHPRS
jgi:hypothetical protein